MISKESQHAIDVHNKIASTTAREPLEQQLTAARAECERLRQRLLTAAGDDLCRLTQEEIKAMTGGAVQIPPKTEFLASCERFHAQIAGEAGVNQGCLTLAQLIAENEKQRQENGDYKRYAKQHAAGMERLKEECDQLRTELAAARAELEAIRLGDKMIDNELDAASAECERLRGERGDLRKTVHELQNDLETAERKVRELTNYGVSGTVAEVAGLQHDVDQLRTELAAATERAEALQREMDWRKEPTFPNWGDVEIKNTGIETPEQLRQAAQRLIQHGECLGGCGSPYGKHTGNALQFDEIAVGDAYLAANARIAELERVCLPEYVARLEQWNTDLREQVERLEQTQATTVELFRRERPEEYESAEVAEWREAAQDAEKQVERLRAAMPTVPHPGGRLVKVIAEYADGSRQHIDGEVILAALTPNAEKQDGIS